MNLQQNGVNDAWSAATARQRDSGRPYRPGFAVMLVEKTHIGKPSPEQVWSNQLVSINPDTFAPLNWAVESRLRHWSEMFQHECQHGNQNQIGDESWAVAGFGGFAGHGGENATNH